LRLGLIDLSIKLVKNFAMNHLLILVGNEKTILNIFGVSFMIRKQRSFNFMLVLNVWRVRRKRNVLFIRVLLLL